MTSERLAMVFMAWGMVSLCAAVIWHMWRVEQRLREFRNVREMYEAKRRPIDNAVGEAPTQIHRVPMAQVEQLRTKRATARGLE